MLTPSLFCSHLYSFYLHILMSPVSSFLSECLVFCFKTIHCISSSHPEPLAINHLSFLFSHSFLKLDHNVEYFSNSSLFFRRKLVGKIVTSAKHSAAKERVNRTLMPSVCCVYLFFWHISDCGSYLLAFHFLPDWELLKSQEWLPCLFIFSLAFSK